MLQKWLQSIKKKLEGEVVSWSFFLLPFALITILLHHPTINKKSDSATAPSWNGNEDDDLEWLPCTKIELTFQGATPCINLKPQSKDIKALIRCAADLGEIYIFLGPLEDDDIQVDDVPSMHTPFSITGLHCIAFKALVAAAQQLRLDEEKDVVDRLYNRSENFYVKPLCTHVCFIALKVILLTYFI